MKRKLHVLVCCLLLQKFNTDQLVQKVIDKFKNKTKLVEKLLFVFALAICAYTRFLISVLVRFVATHIHTVRWADVWLIGAIQGMKLLSKIFFSYHLIIFMLFFLALASATTTFIENDYDMASARLHEYDMLWFELIMAYLCVSTVAITCKQKLWKKSAVFLLHVSFVLMLIGAGAARYFGYEGVIHIREGMSKNIAILANLLQSSS